MLCEETGVDIMGLGDNKISKIERWRHGPIIKKTKLQG